MFPKYIQIQTHSYCNGRCSYCPYQQVNKEVSMGIMNELLFYKIIDECLQHNMKRIVLYLQNEPLMDSRLFHFINYIRNKSKVVIELSTNGILLNTTIQSKLLKVDNLRLLLNINEDTPLNNIFEYVKQKPNGRTIAIVYKGYLSKEKFFVVRDFFSKHKRIFHVSLWNGIVDNRAGNVNLYKNVLNVSSLKGKCRDKRDTEWIHVLWNGDVILCCQDWRRTVILGNVVSHTISDIFNSKEYNIIRDYMSSKKEVPKNFICRLCNRWVT
jgi:hypothetical protein